MGFKRKIKYFLVHTLNISNDEAQRYIDNGEVSYGGTKINENTVIDEATEIKVGDTIVRSAKKYVCYKFYKPRGYQSSLNTTVPDNIASFFPGHTDLSIAGRLDKDSEGLLLLSNHGKWVQQICDPGSKKEKEYIVGLDRDPDDEFIKAFSNGVELGDGMTRPCKCERLEPGKIIVILTEGRYRQIRRMCFKLGYNVMNLKRVRIDSFLLEVAMKSGDIKAVGSFYNF